jgi:ketosteroid isomerase-like protein
MRSLRTLAILILLAAARGAEALQFPQVGNAPDQAIPPGNTVAQQIGSVRDQWATYLQAKKLDALMALYSKEAMFLDSSGGRTIGQPAIRNLCRQVMATFNVNLTLYSIRTVSSGDLAYDSGNYLETLTLAASGAMQNIHGSYIMVFRHEPDGNWKILEQIWTEAPPSEPKPQ